MNPVVIQQLLFRIREEWKALPEECRPWGVWITLHAPLAADAESRRKLHQCLPDAMPSVGSSALCVLIYPAFKTF